MTLPVHECHQWPCRHRVSWWLRVRLWWWRVKSLALLSLVSVVVSLTIFFVLLVTASREGLVP